VIKYLRQCEQFRINGFLLADDVGKGGCLHSTLDHTDEHARFATREYGDSSRAKAGRQ
jgi:hypothetical protein